MRYFFEEYAFDSRIAKLLGRWAERLIADKHSSRGAMANVAMVIGRTASPALLSVLR